MERVKLTYPSTHSERDIERLLEKYQLEYPDMYKNWVDVERDYEGSGENPLEGINHHVLSFLQENTDWEGLRSLSSAWMDMRNNIVSRIR